MTRQASERKSPASPPMLVLAFLSVCSSLFALTAPGDTVLGRHYRRNEISVYRMTAVNDGRKYEAQATGIVKKDTDGAWIEEYGWSNVVFDGVPFALSAASNSFRQILSLDPAKTPALPNLATVQPALIGPITDLLTFYSDLWLAQKVGHFQKVGDHLYHEYGTPSAWADGNAIVVGEDSIDFDITLTELDQSAKTATLLIRHVPPQKPQIKIPVEWMRAPVADTPNNWVNVVHAGDQYIAQVGKETFDVTLTISLADGKILSGSIDNPVTATERVCKDPALLNCGEPHPRSILRRIKISLTRWTIGSNKSQPVTSKPGPEFAELRKP